MIDFTRRLVCIPSVNPPGERYDDCVRLIGEKLTELGISFRTISVPQERLAELAPKGMGLPRPSIVGSLGQGQPELHFHGHYDVVPAVTPDQFQPSIADGRLFGRGAADMKGGLGVILFMLQVLRECCVRLKGTVSFSLTPDEETGGTAGLKYLLDEGYISHSLIGVIDPEPSSGDMIIGSRGALSGEVTVRGRASHVMTQHLGLNAFEQMVDVAGVFQDLKRRVESRHTECRVKLPGADCSILLLGGTFGGGTNFNIVPDRASFSLDRRFNPEERLEDVKREIEEVISTLTQKGIDVGIEFFQEGEASLTDENDPLCRTLAGVVEGVKGRRPDVSICPGLLETRFFVQSGVPAVVYGPGLLEEAHGPRESVSLEEMCGCTEIFVLTVLALMGE